MIVARRPCLVLVHASSKMPEVKRPKDGFGPCRRGQRFRISEALLPPSYAVHQALACQAERDRRRR